MRQLVRRFFAVIVSEGGAFPCMKARLIALPLLSVLLALALLPGAALRAQVPNRVGQQVDPARLQMLPNHHPLWANPANNAGLVPANQEIGGLTLVLERSPEQEQAFEQLIADQQNPASPEFHQWLTPAEVGEQFGLSDPDIATITGWLQAQGLHVNWISPSRIFIGFSGTAADVGQAFGTELHYYSVNGARRFSVAADPTVPQSLAPAIKAIRGLYTIEDQPFHHVTAPQLSAPQLTTGSGSTASHYIAPADFDTIYDVPASLTGAGQTIGIVGESRTNFADFDNFRAHTGATFADPTEVVPTAYGGADPGPAYTSPPSGGASISDQSEATLDVFRAGSVAPAANLLLVVASEASGGVAADAQYLVESTPVPASVISISFGECESSAGSSGVSFWDKLFQQAASEGVSVMVSSGDSGASGCDTAFATPPASPAANSPNSICSSSYATCVGGTEFNDSTSPTQYWSSANGTGLLSALGYIPEGGWNEPIPSGSTTQVAASGGGVSAYVATPSWQTGTGVPTARAGRYTPDISFSSSCHDGYFGCLAADGASCVAGSNGSYLFVGYCGTSAAAPGMAGVTALLDQKLGIAQGNLNQLIYEEAASTPTAFHDVTVSTSGVTSCSVNTPSMCNNSIPGPSSLTGGQAGFRVATGFDEVTGLGSLNVQTFLNNFTAKIVPTVTVTPSPTTITTNQALTVTVSVSGGSGNPTPTGSVTLTSGSYTSAAATLSSGSASITVPAGSLAVGTETLTASYSPDGPGSSTYDGASGSHSVTVNTAAKTTPTVSVTPSAPQITTAQALTVTVAVSGGTGTATPTGSVTLTSGAYTSAATTLASGSAGITVPAGSLASGTDTLTASYTPDTASSSLYNTATGTGTVSVTAKVTPTVTVSPSPASITAAQSSTVTVTVAGGGGYGTPTGSVKLTSGSYTSAATTLASGSASITVPAASLATGTDTLTATYTADATSSPIYNTASGTHTITVSAAKTTPTVSVTPSAPQITTTQALTVTVAVSGGAGTATPTGSVTLTSGTYTSAATTLTNGSASITVPAGTLATGTDTLTASYTPDTAGSTLYNTASGTGTVSVTTKVTPTVTVSPSPASITTAQPTTVAVTVAGGGGFGTPTGSVKLTSGTYTSAATTLASGSASITVPAGSLATGTNTITATYTPDATSSPLYNTASGAASVTVTTSAPAFTVKGTDLTIAAGATSGNTSTITVTPVGGFTGSVKLSAQITSSPTGATDVPTFSFGSTSPVGLTGSSPANATMTVSTTAASSGSCTSDNSEKPGFPWPAGGGVALGCVLIFALPARRRRWMTLLGMVVLSAILATSLIACGGGSSSACTSVQSPGTTPGTYTVIVTGTSTSTTATGPLTLTVQ
jgi:subtilase family serine protease